MGGDPHSSQFLKDGLTTGLFIPVDFLTVEPPCISSLPPPGGSAQISERRGTGIGGGFKQAGCEALGSPFPKTQGTPSPGEGEGGGRWTPGKNKLGSSLFLAAPGRWHGEGLITRPRRRRRGRRPPTCGGWRRAAAWRWGGRPRRPTRTPRTASRRTAPATPAGVPASGGVKVFMAATLVATLQEGSGALQSYSSRWDHIFFGGLWSQSLRLQMLVR